MRDKFIIFLYFPPNTKGDKPSKIPRAVSIVDYFKHKILIEFLIVILKL